MTQPPRDDDDRLLDFLKANRPEVPPASPNLEERILLAIESEPTLNVNGFFQHNTAKCKRLWLVPPAIAVGLMLAWGSDTFRLRGNTLPFEFSFRAGNLVSAEPSDRSVLTSLTITPDREELLKLETFLENTWNSVIASNSIEEETEKNSLDWVQMANAKPQHSSRTTFRQTTTRR